MVKLQGKKTRNKYVSYPVTTPTKLVEVLGWNLGDRIIIEYHYGRKEVLVYKPSKQSLSMARCPS